MKAITLTQPWATLIAIGAKTIETRSWRTAYRGPLAIHAAAGGYSDDLLLMKVEPFYAALTAGGVRTRGHIPLGQIVAVCYLVDVQPIGSHNIPPEPERSFGDYRAGRFAWLLGRVQRLAQPIPARGALGLWEWAAPPNLVL